MTKGQVGTTLKGVNMTEQLVNLTEEDNFYKKYIENGTTTQKGVSLSRATAYLGNANTIPKYYKTNLNNIRRANTPLLKERALKSVKKIGDSWRLKLQLSKYPHPLFIDDFDNEHVSMWFDSEELGLEAFEQWIEGLTRGDRGILKAVKPAYERYCSANGLRMDESFFEINQEVA